MIALRCWGLGAAAGAGSDQRPSWKQLNRLAGCRCGSCAKWSGPAPEGSASLRIRCTCPHELQQTRKTEVLLFSEKLKRSYQFLFETNSFNEKVTLWLVQQKSTPVHVGSLKLSGPQLHTVNYLVGPQIFLASKLTDVGILVRW